MATQNAINISPTAPPVANGGTGVSTFTSDSLIVGAAGSGLASLSAATNGQIPIGQGASSNPTLATLTAGPGMTVTNGAGSITLSAQAAYWTLIKSSNAAVSASLVFNTSTQNNYVFVISNIIPSSNNVQFTCTLANSGGSITSGYNSGIGTSAYTTATLTNANSTSLIVLSTAAELNNSGIYNANLWGYNVTNGSAPYFQLEGCYINNTTTIVAQGVANNTNTTITSFTFAMSSGNIQQGTISMYGINY